jgi:xanthine phosphoribosyltransferase
LIRTGIRQDFLEVSVKLLEDRIRRDGKIFDGDVLKVDSFVNHRIDVNFISELGKEFYRLYGDCGINKILTIEASGIGIACLVAMHFNVPVVFAKKSKSINISSDVYSSKVESFTHGRVYDVIVSKEFLGKDDKVLIIDDFLAMGSALKGLISLTRDAGAEIVGAGIIIEKAYQGGGDYIRNEMGVRVESLARVASMSVEGGVVFCED